MAERLSAVAVAAAVPGAVCTAATRARPWGTTTRPESSSQVRAPPGRPSGMGGACKARSWLLHHLLAGSAELGGKILELGETISHRQNRLGVVDVHTGLERQRRQGGSKHIDQSERRMPGHEMPAAVLAVLPLADGRLFVRANVLGTRRDPDRRRLPKR